MPATNIATNAQLWEFARHINPQFASVTPKGTADLFTDRGWQALRESSYNAINEFWGILVPFYLMQVDIALARDPLESAGFGVTVGDLPGGAIQKIGMNSTYPISPAYRNLQNGKGPDPFVVRKPEANARYFKYNFDYQNLITVPDEWQTKTLFLREYGYAEFMAGIMQGLQNGYIAQKATARYEVFNSAINSTEWPLQDTQRILVQMSDTPTVEELVNFQRTVMNLREVMGGVIQTAAFNAEKHNTIPDGGKMFLFVRPGYETALALDVVRGSYNAETLNLGITIKSVPHFGGLIPYAEASHTTRLYPVYDELGAVIGFNSAENQTTATVGKDEAYWMDPNADVVAVLASTRAQLIANHNAYRVEPIRNPRGLYTNFWASAPDNGIWYDPNATFVVFTTNSARGMSIEAVQAAVTTGAKAAAKK